LTHVANLDGKKINLAFLSSFSCNRSMPASADQLRAQLRRNPADWGVRLELAEALVREGSGQQAAVLISTAPKDPPDIDAVLRAAVLVMPLDPKLAMRFTDRVLAQDEFNVAAALVRARIHQQRNEAEEAHRFAVVAAALDPARCARETALFQWLAFEGLPIALATTADDKEKETQRLSAEMLALALDEEDAPVLVVLEDPSPTRVIVEQAVLVAEEDDDVPALAVVVERPKRATTVIVAKQAELAKQESKADAPPPREDDQDEAVTDEPVVNAPRRNSHMLQKASAVAVAVLVHVVLISLLGLLVVIVPEPPVAELVGIVAPEANQEQPQTKRIMPATMPTPTAVAAAPARAITAAGMSSIALPDFESKTDGPQVMEIATTDLGASFAMPFSPKGTSQVNFFGIKSQGRRVAFLIDAERYMLTDPRGGYPAYEIVKSEIAGMIGKLGLETKFNVVLYEGSSVSAYADKLIPATTANKDKIRDWLYPVNREFEKLGIRPIGYPVQNVQSEVEPVQTEFLSGYLRAIQFALETDVDAVFIITSGFRSMTTPRDPAEMAKLLKQMKWTDKDDQAWAAAVKKGQDWLKQENAARKAKGVPERVIISIGEVWRDMGLQPPRSRPGGNQITAEMREDQVKNAIRLYYQQKNKPKPQINFVIFIGKDQDKETVPYLEHFENIAHRARSGKVRVLQGLGALKNVTAK
jgi:hypothetical protein